ncbi:hypothetical protein L9F63_025996, partial [Diploptera punctata]
AGAAQYIAVRHKRVLRESDRATDTKLKSKEGNHSHASEGASCSFPEAPESELPRTQNPPAGARKKVAPLQIKKRYTAAGETEPEHHIVKQEVIVPPPRHLLPVQPQVFPGQYLILLQH